MALRSYVVIFQNDGERDAEKIFDHISSIADGFVWNFISGVYAFRVDMTVHKIQEYISKIYDGFIVISINPEIVNGELAEEAWESWVFGAFADNFIEKANTLELNTETIESGRKRFMQNRIGHGEH